MRIVLYVVGGLLAVAALLSLVLGHWDVLAGVALGLVAVVAADPFAWRSRRSAEPVERPDRFQDDDTDRTTYYYDVDNTSLGSDAEDD